MTTGELLDQLRAEGIKNAMPHIVGHAVKAGHLKRPRVNGSLMFDWSPADLRAVRKYLANVPKPGRRKAAVSA